LVRKPGKTPHQPDPDKYINFLKFPTLLTQNSLLWPIPPAF
jgi:hypothetical protein